MSPLAACLMAMGAFDETQPPAPDYSAHCANKSAKVRFVLALQRELEAAPPEVDKAAARRYLERELECAGCVWD